MFSSSVDNEVPLFVLNLERISQIISHFDSGLIVYGLYRANQTDSSDDNFLHIQLAV